MKKPKILDILLTIILVTLQSHSNPKTAPAISMKETHVRESYPGVPSLLSLVILSWLLVLDPSRGLPQVTRHWVTQERNCQTKKGGHEGPRGSDSFPDPLGDENEKNHGYLTTYPSVG